MAFVTERISEEDIEKYDLLKPSNEICEKYHQVKLEEVFGFFQCAVSLSEILEI